METLAVSQPYILTIKTSSIIEKSTSTEILLSAVEDEIDSPVTSDVENTDKDCSETQDLIDSAYKNINSLNASVTLI